MTNWKLKIAGFLLALPWQGLGQELDSNGLPAALTAQLQFQDDEVTIAAKAVETAAGMSVNDGGWDSFFADQAVFHTISGRRQALPVTRAEADALGKAVLEEAAAIIATYRLPEEAKECYLALWRLLPDRCRERSGALSDLFPSFPLMPDRCMWDQARIAAAYCTTYDEEAGGFRPAIFAFNLSSVQEYVFTARRTQDFWAGSFMQSYIVWEALKAVADAFGPDTVIYPDLHGQPLADLFLRERHVAVAEPASRERQIAGFPNVFNVLLPQTAGDTTGQLVEQAIADARDAVFRAVDTMLQSVITSDGALHGKIDEAVSDIKNPQLRAQVADALRCLQSGTRLSREWQTIWERQRSHFLTEDCFWICLPWVQDTDGDPRQWLYSHYESLLPTAGGRRSAYHDYRLVADYMRHKRSADAQAGLLYQSAGSLAGRLLTAGKGLRYFEQSAEPGHKCSLCGTRQALTLGSAESSAHELLLRRLWKVIRRLEPKSATEALRFAGNIRSGEHLCAVCLVKRLAYSAYFGREIMGDDTAQPVFPSISSIACASCKQGIITAAATEPELMQSVDKFITVVGGFLKRWRIYRPSAPLPFLARLVQAHPVAGEQHMLTSFLAIDGSWLYEESYEPKTIIADNDLTFSSPEKQAAFAAECLLAADALSELLQAVKRFNSNADNTRHIALPSKYYAVMYMDGDKMSEWVQGRNNPLMNHLLHPSAQLPPDIGLLMRPMDPVCHSSISKALKNFSQTVVPAMIEEHHAAKLVYAGGDDVMALVPLQDCLELIREVRLAFTGEDKPDGSPGWRLLGGAQLLMMDAVAPGQGLAGEAKHGKASASTGVVIAHHSQPLMQVLSHAADVLKKQAKAAYGRDAFAVLVNKRGGEPLATGAKWRSGDTDILSLLGQISSFWGKGLSPALMYAMQQESAGLAAVAALVRQDDKESFDQQLLCKQGRLKWLAVQHSKELAAADRVRLQALLSELLTALEAESRNQSHPPAADQADKSGWNQLADLLLLSRFVSRGGEE